MRHFLVCDVKAVGLHHLTFFKSHLKVSGTGIGQIHREYRIDVGLPVIDGPIGV